MTVSLASAAEVALGRQRTPQHEVGEHQVRYLRSANVGDGRLDLTDVKFMNFTPSEQTTFQLRPGDVLLTEGSGSRETVGASAVWMGELDGPVRFQNTLLRLRPRQGKTLGRYLAWWARHAHASGMFAAVASGANILHLGAEALRAMQLQLPSLEEQRRIADFLDHQVARLDAIAQARGLQVSAATEALQAVLEREYGADLLQQSELRRLSTLLDYFEDGDWIESPYITEDGVRLIQTGNIATGFFREQGFKYISPETFRALRCKSVKPGDVLISRLGSPVSRACRAPDVGGPAIVSVDVVIARPSALLDPDYFVQFLSSPRHLSYADLLARGATMQRLSRSQVGALRIPLIELGEQRHKVRRVSQQWAHLDALSSAISRSVELLQERKRALITAAVTGEFDVSSAGPRAAAVTA